MSHLYTSNFYPVDEFAFDYSLTMNQEASPRRFLGDIAISFESSFTSGLESPSASYPGDYRKFPMDTHSQESVGPVPHDSMFLTEETQGPVGIMPPLPSDSVPTTTYPTQVTYSPAKLTTRKRAVDDSKKEGSDLKKASRPKWEKMDQPYSMRLIKGQAEYRCDICHKGKKKVITATYHDMQRHLQSWAH